MNPPFGAQTKHADRSFIDAALTLAPILYGIFNEGSRAFVASYVEDRGTVTESIRCRFPIKKMFPFHRRDIVEITAEILRIKRNSHA
jgi:putative methylase